MLRTTLGIILLIPTIAVGACSSKEAPTKETAVNTAPPVAEPAHDCEPDRQLGELDTRKPVPLQPMMAWHQKQNMMEHLVAIQRIVDGVAKEDWEEVASASALIETSPQMQQMCKHMGAGADGFTDVALNFHKQADEIGKAAGSHDAKAVLAATSNTLQACTGCHATYRQEIVSAATYQERTGSDHDPSQGHGSEQH